MNLGKSAFTIVFLVGASASLASGSIAVAPDQAVAGVSQAEWSRAWWQWAGSFDVAQSPVADATGTKCGLKQHGPVWFLAGTYGTKRTIRVCAVPHGKYVFFPLVNYVVMPTSEAQATCESCCASRIRTAASNGYYVMLHPLTPGRHVLNFGAVLPSISQAVIYTLMVK